jgi:hypothetical protein
MATASTLIDSGMMENFVNFCIAEQWGMPQKAQPIPWPIVNMDETENKAGMVTEACILEVEHEKNQHLQHFYVTDLGFDRVLLGCYGFWTCTIRCHDMEPGRAFGYFPTLSKEPSHVTCFLTCYCTLSGSHDPTVM